MKIAVLGGGSWGTALAVHLVKKKHEVKVWEFVVPQAQEMQLKRVCPLLPQAKLLDSIFVSSRMEEVLPGAEAIFVVVPSDKVETTLTNAAGLIKDQPIVICSKGLAAGARLLSEVVKEKVSGEVYCLYGPTHAEEVGQGLFSGIVLAGTGKARLKLRSMIRSDNLKVELSKDIIGVQISAALKNILAVFVGVLDGMGLGDNARAYIMTKGLEEIRKVGIQLGAKKDTFYGLAGIGDVIVTCTSKHSRNHYVGEQVGKGRKLEEVLAEMKMVSEGITSLQHVALLKEKLGLELPIIFGLYDILFNGKNAVEVLKRL